MNNILQSFENLIKIPWAITKASIDHFRRDNCSETASALTYVTLLSMVPVATVVFSIVKNFPVIQDGLFRLESLLISVFAPDFGGDISVYLHQFVERSHNLTQWSVIILLITVLWAFSTIEKTFNRIWNVPQPRRTWIRWLTYLLLVIFGPLLLVLGVSATVFFSNQSVLLPVTMTLTAYKSFYVVLMFLISFVVFMFMYRWIPNQHVKWKYAVLGSIVAALLFELSKRMFTIYLAWFPTHEVIYGALALVPLLMIWFHLVWVIILLGAEICFSYEEYCQQRGLQ